MYAAGLHAASSSAHSWQTTRLRMSPAKTSFSSAQSLSPVRLFATPWIAARQASLSAINSRSLPKLKSIESVMPSSHLILCRLLLLMPPTPPSSKVFSNESTLRMRWPEYWSFRIFAPWLGIEPMPPAVEAQNLNHCREVPRPLHFGWLLCSIGVSQVTQR